MARNPQILGFEVRLVGLSAPFLVKTSVGRFLGPLLLREDTKFEHNNFTYVNYNVPKLTVNKTTYFLPAILIF